MDARIKKRFILDRYQDTAFIRYSLSAGAKITGELKLRKKTKWYSTKAVYFVIDKVVK